jgi:hypothetical protein
VSVGTGSRMLADERCVCGHRYTCHSGFCQHRTCSCPTFLRNPHQTDEVVIATLKATLADLERLLADMEATHNTSVLHTTAHWAERLAKILADRRGGDRARNHPP